MDTKKLHPLFFFLSLGTVVTLIATVSSILNLVFETLNHALPDVLTDAYTYGYASYSFEGVRSALALLIIVFPVYLILERAWSMRSVGAEGWNATLRKWAIYLVLFLASVTVLTDLVVLVRYFVSGEITLRFVFKVLTTLIVAGGTAWYYVRALRGVAAYRRVFAWSAVVLVAAVVVWSFSVIGSPLSQRKLRMDQRRTDDLQNIQWQVISYWQQKEKLPTALTDLNNPLSGSIVPQDPEFQRGKIYEYTKTGDKSFELCATFDLPQPKGWVPGATGGGVAYPMTATRDVSVAPYPGASGDNWDHESGRTCYARTIDPELYPPYPKPLKQ